MSRRPERSISISVSLSLVPSCWVRMLVPMRTLSVRLLRMPESCAERADEATALSSPARKPLPEYPGV